jgi:hypothetical protein
VASFARAGVAGDAAKAMVDATTAIAAYAVLALSLVIATAKRVGSWSTIFWSADFRGAGIDSPLQHVENRTKFPTGRSYPTC